MIARLELKNFTAFSDLSIDFSPKVNVIIGENGTGKTHLLKAAYAICSCSSLFHENGKVGKNKIREALTTKLLRLFMPLDNKLGRMYHRGSSEKARLEVRFASDAKVAVSFGARSKSLVLKESENYEHYHDKPIFIPTKEVLSFIKSISAPESEGDHSKYF
ncbi:MAG: AAA family ATPase [Caldilineaceae bacterium]